MHETPHFELKKRETRFQNGEAAASGSHFMRYMRCFVGNGGSA